ncbi:uncharacterized protein M6B38_273275 [Iris pallida]|uniref:Folate receptor-like domain-containing protein n=1 Tax=Iris pallida TaxID=29817 RepID=A0AAX6I4L3_IRIPA|nr:uncharacterized protein M6B38_273275 [Iris pallida]
MGRWFCFVLLLFSNHLIRSSAGQPKGLCISPGGRFPPFSSEGKPPRKVVKGPKDLALCRVFRQSTCCDVSQTYPALLLIRRLASTGEASQECLDLWELLECSICDPLVGVHPGPPRICASLCDKVLQACGTAYFSVDPKSQVLSPCGPSDILCGRASEWASNGTEFCHLAGFAVHPHGLIYNGVDEAFCYGGKASIKSVADSWKSSQSGSHKMSKKSQVLDDFQQWLTEMPISERVSWAVGGMVLTAGLVFISKRKSYSQRQRQAAVHRAAQTAISRAARRVEARNNRQHSVSRR